MILDYNDYRQAENSYQTDWWAASYVGDSAQIAIVQGPFCFHEGEYYVPGGTEGEYYVPGGTEGEAACQGS